MLGAEARRTIEAEVLAALQRGDERAAAEHVIRAYGPEIFGLITRVLGRTAASEDVFSFFCEQVWLSLPNFEWRASLRTWVYVIARRSIVQHRRAARRRGARERRLETSEAAALAADITRSSLANLQAREDRLAVLRASLTASDQLLLILRIDRAMPWSEIAAIVRPEGTESGRAAAALRKRYERITGRLRNLAREHGLTER